MSHGITAEDGMAYVGQVPWHGLGVSVPEGISIDGMLDAAGLRWPIRLADLSFSALDALGMQETFKVGHKAMYRGDTMHLLDVVGPEYVPAQNDEVLAFFRDYLASGDMQLNTAGSLHGGRWVWGLASLRQDFELAGGDKVSGYMLVANPNKYGRGLVVKLVATRVVCNNTLTVALGEGGRSVSIVHNREFNDEARTSALAKMGFAIDAFHTLAKEAEVFSTVKLEKPAVDRVIAATFKLDLETNGTLLKETRTAKRVRELFEGAGLGAKMISAEGTAWGMLNAVTQFVDHEYARTSDSRLRNSWFGSGQATKNRARKALWAEAA